MPQMSQASGLDSESDLREWFELLLQLKAKGLTPHQVKELVARGSSNNGSGIVRDAFKNPPEKNSWCF